MSLSPEELRYHHRQLLLPDIGYTNQLKLKDSVVGVAGAGGLGCPVLEILNSAGVGELVLIDRDTVEESNLHRQSLFDNSQIGLPKVEAAVLRLAKRNPHTKLKAFNGEVSSFAKAVWQHCDLIIDCTDNYETRYWLSDYCVQASKPLLSGALHRLSGQLSLLNYPIGQGPSYRCIFPEVPSEEQSAGCNVIGTSSIITQLIGSAMAAEAVQLLIGEAPNSAGKLMLFDLEDFSWEGIACKRQPQETKKAADSNLLWKDYLQWCRIVTDSKEGETFEMSLNDLARLKQAGTLRIIDIRLPEEQPETIWLGTVQLPGADSGLIGEKFKKDDLMAIHCQSGKRSLTLVQELRSMGFSNVYSIEGGALALAMNQGIFMDS